MLYVLTFRALQQIKKLPRDVQRRVLDKLDFFCAQGAPLSFAERLTHPAIGTYRFRVGDYRVIADIESEHLLVVLIGHRRDIYRP